MKISVWDTYVERADKEIMHFDILVPEELQDEQKVYAYGMAYLRTKSFETGRISADECRFCHVEKASDEVIQDINENGFHIIEMQNCN